MKWLIWNWVACLPAITLSQGCFYPPASATFQVVDGETRVPLQNVDCRRRSDVAIIDMIFGRALIFGGQPGTYSLPATDKSGVVLAKGLTGDLQHFFTFEKPGYYAAHVGRGADNGRFTVELPPDVVLLAAPFRPGSLTLRV